MSKEEAMIANDFPTVPNADYYKHFEDQRDHILERPGMYVGAIDKVPYIERIMIFPEGKPQVITTNIDVPAAIERIYLEVLSNAADNVDRSRRLNINVDTIDIAMDRKTITIRNGGCPIPIEYSNYKDRAGKQMYVPELIFGTLLSSSTYGATERTGCGSHGIGVKLTSVFALSFDIHIGNANQKLQYKQTWTDHMKNRSDPEITAYTGRNFVSISYDMDFLYFKYPPPEQEGGGYTDEMIALFARHAADISFTSKCPVTFNGVPFCYQDVMSYAELYFGEKVKSAIIHYEWPPGTETVTKKGHVVAKDPNIVPTVELCFLDTVDDSTCISFVNGMITREGGVHVNTAFKMISSDVLEKINKSIERSRKKSKDKKEEGRKRPTLTIADVKPHISMLLSCHLPNPQYVSQSKTSLSGPTPKINIPERLLKMVEKWELMSRLYAAVEAKDFRNLTKSDGKKKRHIGNHKAEDANNAGGKDSQNCILYLVEGDSAKNYPITMMGNIPNARDLIGVMPLKGKVLNVMNAPASQIAENQEIQEIKEILGLQEGLDYSIQANYQKLRYGRVIVLADSDADAKHIIGLIMNYFYCKYPSLLAIGFIYFLRTPIIRISKNKQTMKFYSFSEYDKWKNAVGTESRTWKHKYCKGLGSSTAPEIKSDSDAPRFVACIYDDTCPQAFRLAFDDKLANLRKEWIANHKTMLGIEDIEMLPISHFLYYEFAEYAVANVKRCIPKLLDGLKEVQRKTIWGALTKWGSKKNGRTWSNKILTGNTADFKVVMFVAHVMSYGYLYGDKSLEGAITGMCQDFCGTNNMPYLQREGCFGDRNEGKAASARYIFTKPEWWLPYVFKNADMNLLTLVEEEGEFQEPETFIPIIPLVLVNGAMGIATGHSTFVPNHNPIDLCNWLIAKINGDELPELLPWYRDYTGTIRVEIKTNRPIDSSKEESSEQTEVHLEGQKPEIHPEDEESDEDLNDPLGPNDQFVEDEIDQEVFPSQIIPEAENIKRAVMITEGVFKVENGKVVITEFPIGYLINNYKNWLQTLVDDKTIEDYRNLSGPNTVYFEITGMKNPTLKKLRLTRSFGMTNMCLLDVTGRPRKFKTASEIMEYFYENRLPYYDMRRRNFIDSLEIKIKKLTNKMLFIKAVITGQIIIFEKGSGRKKADVIAQVEKLGLPKELGNEITTYHYSEDDVNKLQNDINELNEEKLRYEQTKPSDMWLSDIEEFMDAYHRYYRDVYESPSNLATGSAGIAASSSAKKRGGRKSSSTRGRGGKTARGRKK